MAKIIKRNGKIVKRNGRILKSIDGECCCFEGECCACDTLNAAILLAKDLEVTITGDITGVCRMILDDPGHRGPCKQWGWLFDTGTCFEALGGCEATWHLQHMFFYCPSDGTLPSNYQFESNLSNAGCRFAPGNATPNMAEVAWKPAEIQCADLGNGLDDFYARFVFPVEDIIPGGCNCATVGSVTFELRVLP